MWSHPWEVRKCAKGEVRKEVCQNVGSTMQSTLEETSPFSQINMASQMIISINTTVNCSVEPRFGTLPSWFHHPIKAISQLFGYCYKYGSIGKQKEHDLQWYTLQYISCPNNSSIPNFFVGILYVNIRDANDDFTCHVIVFHIYLLSSENSRPMRSWSGNLNST